MAEEEGGDIVITALPFQVSGSKVIQQIAQQITIPRARSRSSAAS